MEELYHDKSIRPMKDFYQSKKEDILNQIQAAKVLRKNPNSSMKNSNKPEKEEKKDAKQQAAEKENEA